MMPRNEKLMFKKNSETRLWGIFSLSLLVTGNFHETNVSSAELMRGAIIMSKFDLKFIWNSSRLSPWKQVCDGHPIHFEWRKAPYGTILLLLLAGVTSFLSLRESEFLNFCLPLSLSITANCLPLPAPGSLRNASLSFQSRAKITPKHHKIPRNLRFVIIMREGG